MKADNKKNIDELISGAIGRETPKFEFDQWKQSHKKEIETYESQTVNGRISQSVQPLNIWRIILKSRISKITTAAMIIIVGTIVISHFGDSSEFNQTAWGQMLESMQKMPWVHISKTIEPPKFYDAIERWTCFNPSIKIFKYTDGMIRYSDYSKGEGYHYKPKENTITISPITGKYNIKSPQSPFEIVNQFYEMTENLEAEIDHSYSRIDGKKVEIIESEYVTSLGQCHTRMVRDVDQNLLKSSQTTIYKSETDETITTTSIYDYPESGPRDIYEVGAPRDAQIVDLRLPNDAQALLNEVQWRYDRAYGDCIAMILQSWVYEDGTQEPRSIIMFRQCGKLHRMDLYYASDIKRFDTLYNQIKADWPNLTIEQVKSYERNAATERQVIYDGTYTTNRYRVSRDEVRSNRRKSIMRLGYGDSINSLAWFEPPIYGSNRFRIECDLLESDPEHKGLIGLNITKLPVANISRDATQPSQSDLANIKPASVIFDINRYWLDPLKDYLVIEHTEIRSGRKTTNTTLEMKQTPSGQWYPSHIYYEYTHPLPGGKQRVNRIDKRIVLDTEPVFPEEMFRADYVFNAP